MTAFDGERSYYRSPRDPHGYIRLTYIGLVAFIVAAIIAASFLAGAIWQATR